MSRMPWRFKWSFKKLKRHKSPSIDQIPAELIKADDRTFFIYYVLNQEELFEDWKGLKDDKTKCINYKGKSVLSITYKVYSTSLSQSDILMQRKLLGIISMDFDATS
jgi:hypothetical protein